MQTVVDLSKLRRNPKEMRQVSQGMLLDDGSTLDLDTHPLLSVAQCDLDLDVVDVDLVPTMHDLDLESDLAVGSDMKSARPENLRLHLLRKMCCFSQPPTTTVVKGFKKL